LDAAEKQLAEGQDPSWTPTLPPYEDGFRTLADALGVDAEQLDAFIGWLAQTAMQRPRPPQIARSCGGPCRSPAI
jgi:hypothetical protein